MKRSGRTSDLEQCTQAGYPGALLCCPDFILTKLGYFVSEIMEEALEPCGLRMRHYRMLRILHADGPQAQNAVGAQLGMDRTSVVALVDDLERMGLAQRERSSDDRRAYCIKLTPKGRKTIARAIKRLAAAENAMFRPLGAKERGELQRLATILLAQPGPIEEQHRREFRHLRRRTAKRRPVPRS